MNCALEGAFGDLLRFKFCSFFNINIGFQKEQLHIKDRVAVMQIWGEEWTIRNEVYFWDPHDQFDFLIVKLLNG